MGLDSRGYDPKDEIEDLPLENEPDDKIGIIKFWFEFESILQYLKTDEMLKQRELCV